MEDLVDIKAYLEKHNIKPSIQRIEILKCLLGNKTHPTIDDVYIQVNYKIPTLSRTTVYNTLKLFCEHKVASCLTIDDKNIRFDGDTYPHAHFKCDSCGSIRDLGMVNPDAFPFYQKENLSEAEMHLYFLGVCPDCSRR